MSLLLILRNAAAGEATLTPGVGLVTAAGQIPDEYRELNQAADVGLVTIGGLAPTVVQGSEDVRGHVITKKRRRSSRIYQYDLSDSAAVSVPAIALEPPQVIDPPHSSFVVDTAAVSAKVTRLEVRRARIARMRREEEELIAILMRAA